MYPCSNPQVCGVQNHKEGTVCKALQSNRKTGTEGSSVRVPTGMLSSESSHKPSGPGVSWNPEEPSEMLVSLDTGGEVLIVHGSKGDDPDSEGVAIFDKSTFIGGSSSSRFNKIVESAKRGEGDEGYEIVTHEGELYLKNASYVSTDSYYGFSSTKLSDIDDTMIDQIYRDDYDQTGPSPIACAINEINKDPRAIDWLMNSAREETDLDHRSISQMDKAE